MRELFDKEFYRALQRFSLTAHVKMNAGMGGGRKSNAKGSSVEFSDFREYQLGDDIRRIDWNAYGRMNKLFVKLFMEEKEGLFTILTDCSASMLYGGEEEADADKFVRARQIAAMLSYLVLQNLDRVSLVSLEEEGAKRGKSLTGRQSFEKVMTRLSHYQAAGKVDLYEAVRRLPFSGRGVCYVISDFLDQAHMEELCRYLLFRKQEVVLVQVLAIEEILPEMEGDYTLHGIEDGRKLRVSFSGAVIKKYKELLKNYNRNLQSIAAHYQIPFIQTDTKEPLEKVLAKGIAAGCID